MIRFEEVQERILDQVQARIKPVANKAIAALADKAPDPVANRRKRKPGRYRDPDARRAYMRAYMAKRGGSSSALG
jgi:hypothetical protein